MLAPRRQFGREWGATPRRPPGRPPPTSRTKYPRDFYTHGAYIIAGGPSQRASPRYAPYGKGRCPFGPLPCRRTYCAVALCSFCFLWRCSLWFFVFSVRSLRLGLFAFRFVGSVVLALFGSGSVLVVMLLFFCGGFVLLVDGGVRFLVLVLLLGFVAASRFLVLVFVGLPAGLVVFFSFLVVSVVVSSGCLPPC